jgi:hypothetical protein
MLVAVAVALIMMVTLKDLAAQVVAVTAHQILVLVAKLEMLILVAVVVAERLGQVEQVQVAQAVAV